MIVFLFSFLSHKFCQFNSKINAIEKDANFQLSASETWDSTFRPLHHIFASKNLKYITYYYNWLCFLHQKSKWLNIPKNLNAIDFNWIPKYGFSETASWKYSLEIFLPVEKYLVLLYLDFVILASKTFEVESAKSQKTEQFFYIFLQIYWLFFFHQCRFKKT